MSDVEKLKRFIKYRRGIENCCKAKNIAAVTGLTTRDIQDAARELRADGFPIVSSCRAPYFGYYVATCREELDLFRAQLSARRNDLNRAIEDVDKLYEQFPCYDEPEELGPLFVGGENPRNLDEQLCDGFY